MIRSALIVVGWMLLLVGEGVAGTLPEPQFVFSAARFYGGAGDQFGTGVAVAGGYAYVSGSTAANGDDALVMRYALPLGTAPEWAAMWPQLSGGDRFLGLGVSSEGVYLAGYSWGRTTDTVGGKEDKGITVKFPLAGPPGGGYGGAVWDVQTPGPPGAFSYGGGENLNAGTVTEEAGQVVAYVTGRSQAGFSNGARLYVSKVSAAGVVQWTVNDGGGSSSPMSSGLAVTVLDGVVYVAGRSADPGQTEPYLRQFFPNGSAGWVRWSGLAGEHWGVAGHGGALYTVGATPAGGGDFLVEKWSADGVRQWSRTYDHEGGTDVLYGVVAANGRLYAVGSTTGGTAGGADMALLEFDPDTGDLIGTSIIGGAQDDVARSVASDGLTLYVVGDSKSYGFGGNAVGESDLVLFAVSLAPIPGNVNRDGTVDAADLAILLNYLGGNLSVGEEPFLASLDTADMDGDGAVDVEDLLALAQWLAGSVD